MVQSTYFNRILNRVDGWGQQNDPYTANGLNDFTQKANGFTQKHVLSRIGTAFGAIFELGEVVKNAVKTVFATLGTAVTVVVRPLAYITGAQWLKDIDNKLIANEYTFTGFIKSAAKVGGYSVGFFFTISFGSLFCPHLNVKLHRDLGLADDAPISERKAAIAEFIAARKKAEEEYANNLQAEVLAAAKKAEEEAAKKAQEEAAKKAQEEAAKKAQEEAVKTTSAPAATVINEVTTAPAHEPVKTEPVTTNATSVPPAATTVVEKENTETPKESEEAPISTKTIAPEIYDEVPQKEPPSYTLKDRVRDGLNTAKSLVTKENAASVGSATLAGGAAYYAGSGLTVFALAPVAFPLFGAVAAATTAGLGAKWALNKFYAPQQPIAV